MEITLKTAAGNTRISMIFVFVLMLVFAAHVRADNPVSGRSDRPERLSQTGLWLDGTREVDPAHLAYTPQYPLWSDGTRKRRWLSLPVGTAIDAENTAAWTFPVGTRVWKEFGFSRPVETRLIERLADGGWRFTVYVWAEDGSDAELAPAEGLSRHPAPDAPGGRYAVPSQDDCLACHEGPSVPVLGFSALQLSADRDPRAPHAETPRAGDANLARLVEMGKLVNLPAQVLTQPPRIAGRSPTERAAMGYLHANCGHCHNAAGALELVDLVLAHEGTDSIRQALQSLLGRPSEFRFQEATLRVVAGQPAASVLALRMRSRHPLAQMPPLGTRVPDTEGIALIEHWIQHDLLTVSESIQ